MTNENKKSFYEYYDITKRKSYICTIFLLLINIIFVYISFIIDNYLLVVIGIVIIVIFSNIIKKYYNIKKIQTYLKKHNLLENIGNIEFTHQDNCLFTEYYIIYIYKKNVMCFKYSNVEKLYKEYCNIFSISRDYNTNKIEVYIHFVIKNKMECNILTDLTNIIFRDDTNANKIINFILNKNSNIIIENDVSRNKLSMK